MALFVTTFSFRFRLCSHYTVKNWWKCFYRSSFKMRNSVVAYIKYHWPFNSFVSCIRFCVCVPFISKLKWLQLNSLSLSLVFFVSRQRTRISIRMLICFQNVIENMMMSWLLILLLLLNRLWESFHSIQEWRKISIQWVEFFLWIPTNDKYALISVAHLIESNNGQ